VYPGRGEKGRTEGKWKKRGTGERGEWEENGNEFGSDREKRRGGGEGKGEKAEKGGRARETGGKSKRVRNI